LEASLVALVLCVTKSHGQLTIAPGGPRWVYSIIDRPSHDEIICPSSYRLHGITALHTDPRAEDVHFWTNKLPHSSDYVGFRCSNDDATCFPLNRHFGEQFEQRLGPSIGIFCLHRIHYLSSWIAHVDEQDHTLS